MSHMNEKSAYHGLRLRQVPTKKNLGGLVDNMAYPRSELVTAHSLARRNIYAFTYTAYKK